MKISQFKKPVLSAIVFFGTLGMLSAGYAAFTSLSTVGNGSTLTSTAWNAMVENLNDLDNRWMRTSANSLAFTGSYLRLGNSSSGSRISSNEGTRAGIWLRYTDENMYVDSDKGTIFRINGTSGYVNGMLLDSTGKLGVGTSAPTERLDVGGGNVKMGYEIVTNDCVGTTVSSCQANCPTWKYVTGGGCVVDNSVRYVFRTYPNSNGWACHSQWNLENAGSILRAYAICANIR